MEYHEWMMCGRKKSYHTSRGAKASALRHSLHRVFRHYHCPYCTLWHITKKVCKTVECVACDSSFDFYSHDLVRGFCNNCIEQAIAEVFKNKRKMITQGREAVFELFNLFKVLTRLHNQVIYPLLTEENRKLRDELATLKDFSLSLNRAAVYLSRRVSLEHR